MRKDHIPLINGDEYDWVSRKWRKLLCVFSNTTGLGKKVKRAINRRGRRMNKQELSEEAKELYEHIHAGRS